MIIDMASSTCNATLSIHPMMFKRLKAHCEGWMEKLTAFDAVKLAGKLLIAKLRKYSSFLNSNFAQLALVLDPRNSNKGECIT